MTSQNDTQLLVVGAGVVGLAASLFLSQHGIKTTVIERRAGTSIHPRSRSVNQRATELFRHLGIEKAVLDAGKEIATSKGMYKGTSVREAIEPHQRKEGGSKNPAAQAAGLFGPTKGSFVTQDYLEPLFLETAEQQNVTVRFSTEFQSMAQDHNGVKTTVKDRKTGEISTISSDYVIAADGARSPVCQALDVKKGGRGVVGHMINILFKADMAAFVKNREFSQVRVRGQKVQGLFCAINNSDRWVFHLSYDPARGEKASDFNKENCVDLVREASGMPDLKVEIESLLPWEAAVTYAEQMRHGRVFIAGDAAHQMPPWAGQGANSGYADVHNLAWKIAAVIKGQAGDALLDTYSVERQPVGKNAAEASAGGIDERGFADLNLKSLTVLRAFARKGSLINGLGYRYDSAAICYEDTWPLHGWTWKPLTMAAVFFDLDGRPGRRVPHLWVERDLKRISTIDLIEHSFTLLTAESGEKWKEVASWIQKELGVQIHIHSIGPKGDVIAKAGEWTTAAGIASTGALLVRPDDFVAARWRRTPTDATAELRKALLQVLQRNA